MIVCVFSVSLLIFSMCSIMVSLKSLNIFIIASLESLSAKFNISAPSKTISFISYFSCKWNTIYSLYIS
jgi:hypothetical protein